MTTTLTPPAVKVGPFAPPYRALTTGAVALVSLVAFEALAIATAMPTVARDLDGLGLYGMAFGSTLAASIVGMVVGGAWSDDAGPGRALYAGVGVFAAGLVVAGLAPTMAVLVIGRTIQGLGGGMQVVALYVVVGQAYPPELRPRLFSWFSAAWVVPAVVGPTIAGALVEHAHWRFVFLGVPLLIIPAIWLVRVGFRSRTWTVASERTPRRPGRVRGAIVVAASALLLHQAVNIGDRVGSGAVSVAVVLVSLVGVFLAARPLLPGGTMAAARGLPSVVLLRGLTAAAFFGGEVMIPLMLSERLGWSPTAAGTALTIGAMGWSAGSWVQGSVVEPERRAVYLRAGAGLLALGLAGVSLALVPGSSGVVAVVAWGVAGSGMGLMYPILSVLTLELSAPAEQGLNTSALQLSDALLTTISLALVGALIALGAPTTGTFVLGLLVAASIAATGVGVAGRATP